MQNLVLTDRTPVTPVNFTFVPRDIDPNGVGSVINTTGTPVGEKRCSVSMKKRNNRFVGELRLALPVVATETVNGVSKPVVIRTAYVTLTATFDERSSKQERDDAIGMMASALSVSKLLVNDTLVNLESVW